LLFSDTTYKKRKIAEALEEANIVTHPEVKHSPV
jgi:hypothetical protein